MTETHMREFVRSRSCLLHRALWHAAAAALLIGGAVPCHGQSAPRLDLGGTLEVGGEAERYLRMLQLSGGMPASSWTLQPYIGGAGWPSVPPAGHPWSGRFARPDTATFIRWLRPSVRTILNSSYPVQEAVGPVWAGRGATVSVQGGLAARFYRVTLQLAPVAFVAQNAAFSLAPNGETGRFADGDARFPRTIDYPQRFGSASYGRLDLGTSSVDLDLSRVAIGVSNAPQRWGPALEYPLVLGPGAGGFPHYYIGTTTPLNLGIGRVQGRLIGGILSQSAFSAATPDKAQRFASAALVTFSPRGIDGLEVGFDRFFESSDGATVRRALLPISLSKFTGSSPSTSQNEANENQTASAFFRWAPPRGGLEVYGEWYREDYSGQLRTFFLNPDDLSSFVLGFQRVFEATPVRRHVVRFEIVNGELPASERLVRNFTLPEPPYVHAEVLQGHTQRGLLLGSPEAYGGEGWRASVDSYTPDGRRTFGIERALRFDWLPTSTLSAADTHPDVAYSVRGEMLRFAGSRDYGATLLATMDLNRNLEPGNTTFNLHAAFTVRGW
jgi:hypothetical protein